MNRQAVLQEFSPEGTLGRGLLGYERRPEQHRMARAVAETFDRGGVLAVEAGTGVGKSLAYLVPAIHWARSQEERVVVSTATINLQEQLVHVDLPLLEQHLGVPFRAALVKGRRNYLCLRKAAEIEAEPALVPDEAHAFELQAILRWRRETDDGSLADLDFLPRPEVWHEVTTDHDDCLRSRCPDYDDCFFYRARRSAAEADVLVVNHHLLLADRALRASAGDESSVAILPDASRLVIDEAHHLEDVATDALATKITRHRIERALRELQNPRRADKGILPLLARRLRVLEGAGDRELTANGIAREIDERLRPRIPGLIREVTHCLDALTARVDRDWPGSGGAERQLRVTPTVRATPLWEDTRESLTGLVRNLESFCDQAEPLLGRLALLSDEAREPLLFPMHQLAARVGRLRAVLTDVAAFLGDGEELCRWYSLESRSGGPSTLWLSLAPVEAGEVLRETVFRPFDGVVLTSATITVGNRFDHFLGRTGLSGFPEGTVEALRLESPFRFPEQAIVAVPTDLPFPDTPGYEAAVLEGIARVVEASRGGAFLLFTSYAALRRAHGELAPRFDELGLDVLRQGELGRHALLERFRRSGTAALFATDSFWEGVDVRGDALRAVVIARLPFRVPTEPIQEARVEAITARGGNAFVEYSVPQAVIRLRQGFGRLIRSRDDTGAVVLLDSRIAHRRYGSIFLDSLPPARVVRAPREEAYREVEGFFRSRRAPA